MNIGGKLTGGQKGVLALLLIVGIGASVAFAQLEQRRAEAAWAAAAEAEAERLTATFALLYDTARAPLQSLATLFNGSGRVAAEEFTQTIADLKGRSGPSFPSAMAFMTSSTPASCDAVTGCWLVSYSTAEDGLLKPGADMSRFAPTAQTIAAALADENTMKLGPVYREADGAPRSFLAVTIKNTRQFGVIAAVIDYAMLARDLGARWLPPGVSLRAEAAFSTGASMTPAIALVGEAAAAPGTALTVARDFEADRAKFKLHWDFARDFAGGPRSANALLTTGVLGTIVVVLLLGLLLAGQRD
jgi:hypothetical protein